MVTLGSLRALMIRAVSLPYVVAAVSVCVAAASSAKGPYFYEQWGEETLALIERDFRLPRNGGYSERARDTSRKSHVAFNWPVGVQLTALTASARSSAENLPRLEQFLGFVDTYWIEHEGIGGYNSTVGGVADRYYDDNAWIVLGLVEAFEVTGDRCYLNRAIEAFNFVLSGEDRRHGGGIYWRESPRRTKNTCSNAPAIVCALRLYQHTQSAKHLDAAERLYRWVNDKLVDTESGLLHDHLRPDGRINRRKYTYNTGLMLRAACLYYELLDDPRYLEQAVELARAAENRWVEPDRGRLTGQAKFAHLLLEAFLKLDRVAGRDRGAAIARQTIAGLRAARGPKTGRYPAYWLVNAGASGSDALIDQASAARAFYAVALHEGAIKTPDEQEASP